MQKKQAPTTATSNGGADAVLLLHAIPPYHTYSPSYNMMGCHGWIRAETARAALMLILASRIIRL